MARRFEKWRATVEWLQALSNCFFELWLQVEADNAPARTLYEKKLGFEEEWADKGARALRIDEEDEGGAFKDVVVPTVTASKFLARG